MFSGMSSAEDYLMLWQNANAVIVGRFQNTAKELNTAFIRDNQISVVRRLSGGGAVYHDLGNLNYTFIRNGRDAKAFDFSFFTKPLIDTLATFGVKAELSGRNDVTVEGRKISGNAQYSREGRVMHHGTILFSSDLSVLTNALRVGRDKIQGKGVASVRSRVANLNEYIKGASLDDFIAAFLNQLDETEGIHSRVFSDEDLARATELKQKKYDLWEWNYGSSPPYTVEKTRRIENFGRIELYLQIEKGRLTSFHSRGDYFGDEDISGLASLLHGRPMEESDLREALSGIDVGKFYRNLNNDAFIELLLS